MTPGLFRDARDGAPPARRAMRVSHSPLRRGRRLVLGAGELHLPLGATVALVGANGAGKTTLLLAVAGLLAARGGTARTLVAGEPVRRIGYVAQRPAFPPWLRLGDVLALHEVGPETLDVLGPATGRAALLARPAGELSVGQAQALATAIALVRRDPLVLLDEPFAGVDLGRRLALEALVHARRARQPAVVVVLSSHVAAELDALCDWVVALRGGACVFQGPRGALPPAPAPGGTAAVAGASELARRLAALTG